MKTKAIRIHQHGGPEVLQFEEIDLADLRPGEIRVRNKAVGLNFIETYFRSGLYPVPLPFTLGSEAAGVVDAVGEGVTNVKVGDRIAYNSGGAYAELTNVPAARALPLPAGVSDDAAACLLLKGSTAEYLLRRTFRVEAGQTILWHAAAGGVGLIATQWAKHLGCTVIGTVGSDDKIAIAKAHGCDHVINYRTENTVERVKEITGGKKVPVVYDGVGKDTFMTSLDCLSPRGLLVSFGNASGPVTGVDLGILAAKGSLYVTRPTLATYAASPKDYAEIGAEVFDVVAKGAVKIEINQRYKLADAAQAHRDLEARKTTGATVLVP
ncbi:NADPH:quinone reductase [Parvibaculum sedimenti]|uniref:NADPH:quinone reductase n=1 Tax=Parvibaculum sedimenti TaxID=2608632 RepID=A0A6N6VEA0_9HYPH|nr:quinone oxidoreductase [Parvibaculum sedimenti]KAB7738498.1 NADPH:quinone reductase [Parvibaculum sedimenti]